MASFSYKNIGLPLDLLNWEVLNENFKNVARDLNKISNDILEEVSDAASLRYLSPVATLSVLSSTYPDAKEGDAAQTLDDNKIYRYNGTNWVFVQQFGSGPFTDVYNQLALQRSFINVKSFGAVGDGVSDDTNAIRSAIQSLPSTGGNIYFPNGKYRITDSIVLKNGTIITGETSTGALIYPDCDIMNTSEQTSVTPCFRVSSSAKNIGFYKIGVDSSKASNTIMASTLITSGAGISNFFAFDIYGKDVYQLLKFSDCSDMYFEKILLVPPTKVLPVPPENALSFVRCRNVNISNLIVYGTAEIIDMSQCINVTIDNVIGESGVGDENEAFDIGGCKNVTIDNCITNGFGEAVKLKQEGNLPTYLITEDITISNCQFREFSKAGIELLTNKVLADYVIKNIKISNCTIESSVTNSRGIYQVSSVNNYGFENVEVRDTKIEVPNYAIDVANASNFKLKGGNALTSSLYSAIKFISDVGHPYAEKTKDFGIDDTEIKVSGNGKAIDLARIYGFTMKDVTIDVPKSTSSSNYAVYLLNVKDPKITRSKISGGGYGISLNWTTSETYLHSTAKMITAFIKDNEIKNFGVYGVRLNVDMPTDLAVTYKYARITNNDFYIDENTSQSGQTAIQFRARRITGGFDYIKADQNTMYRVPTAIGYDGVTLGSNSVVTPNMIYTGA